MRMVREYGPLEARTYRRVETLSILFEVSRGGGPVHYEPGSSQTIPATGSRSNCPIPAFARQA